MSIMCCTSNFIINGITNVVQMSYKSHKNGNLSMLLLAASHIQLQLYNSSFLSTKIIQKTCKYILFKYILIHIIHSYHTSLNNPIFQ